MLINAIKQKNSKVFIKNKVCKGCKFSNYNKPTLKSNSNYNYISTCFGCIRCKQGLVNDWTYEKKYVKRLPLILSLFFSGSVYGQPNQPMIGQAPPYGGMQSGPLPYGLNPGYPQPSNLLLF